MKTANKDVLYFETGPDNEPTLHVDPGKEFEVITQMNRGPWLANHPDGEALSDKLKAGNPSGGRIYVNGAMPGQVLTVNVGEIETEPFGFTRFRGQNGAMPRWLGGSGIRHHERGLQIEDGHILWSDDLKLPISPVPRVVGVAPERTRWTNAWAGEWGGNFDILADIAGQRY